MSTVIAKNVQVGTSGTPAQNFTVYQPASPDGTVRVGNGNSGSVTDLLTLNSSGNLGLGVTPSTWSGWKAIGTTGASSLAGFFGGGINYTVVGNNWFAGSGGDTYISTAPASYYMQSAGSHIWRTAGSGTAGNAITFTQAMTLDADRRLALNTTSFVGNEQAIIQFNSSGTVTQALNTRDGNASANNNAHIVLRRSDDTYLGSLGRNGTDTAMFVEGNSYLTLRTGGTERARINSSGNLLVGRTNDNGGRLQVTATSNALAFQSNEIYRVFNANAAFGSTSTTRTCAIPFTSQGNNWSGHLVEIIFTGANDASSAVIGGKATYAVSSLTGLGVTEIQDIGAAVSFAASVSGTTLTITATTTTAVNWVGWTIRVTSTNGFSVPTSISLA
jgi:hypothetical protein